MSGVTKDEGDGGVLWDFFGEGFDSNLNQPHVEHVVEFSVFGNVHGGALVDESYGSISIAK